MLDVGCWMFCFPFLNPRLHHLRRVVPRSIVHEHDFEVGILHAVERAQAFAEGLRAIVAADDDGDFGITREFHARRDRLGTGEFFLQNAERFLRRAVARDEAEFPIQNLVPAGEPLVGPRKENRAGGAAFDHDIEMPVEHLGLHVLALAHRIEAEFAEDHRLVFRQILQARDVAFEIRAAFQIDVEAVEIDVRWEEIFRRRITRVAVERTRIGGARDGDQLFEKLDDAARAEPAHHRGGHFIPDEVSEDRRMPRVLRHGLADRPHDLPAQTPAVQKLDVLRPRN